MDAQEPVERRIVTVLFADLVGFTTSARERFRTSNASWWIAKSIRLLERAGAADRQLAAEVEQIRCGQNTGHRAQLKFIVP